MPSNHSPTEGALEVQEFLHDRMLAYDALPSALKQELDDAPIELSAIGTLKMWIKVGCDTKYAVEVFRASVQRAFPGYTPPRARRTLPRK